MAVAACGAICRRRWLVCAGARGPRRPRRLAVEPWLPEGSDRTPARGTFLDPRRRRERRRRLPQRISLNGDAPPRLALAHRRPRLPLLGGPTTPTPTFAPAPAQTPPPFPRERQLRDSASRAVFSRQSPLPPTTPPSGEPYILTPGFHHLPINASTS